MQKSGEENSALKTELEKAHEVVTEKSGMVIDLQGKNNNIVLSSADDLCLKFGPRSGSTELFDALMVLLKEMFEKLILKNQQTPKKNFLACKENLIMTSIRICGLKIYDLISCVTLNFLCPRHL